MSFKTNHVAQERARLTPPVSPTPEINAEMVSSSNVNNSYSLKQLKIY